MELKMKKESYHSAEEILNSKHATKTEIESIVRNPGASVSSLSRPKFNKAVREQFANRGWQHRAVVFDEPEAPRVILDFLKNRVGIKICTSHSTFIGSDLLRFQLASHSSSNKIDVGVYIVTTRNFQKQMLSKHDKTWEGSMTYERVTKYLPYFENEIQVPILVIGIDI